MENLRITSVQRIGNSLGVIIPAHVARELGFTRGDQIVFAVYSENQIVLRKLTQEEIINIKPPIINVY